MAKADSKSTETTPTPFPSSIDPAAVEAATERVRELSEKLIVAAKDTGLVALEAYEKSLQSLVDFEEKVASASQLDWVSALAATHAKVIQDLSSSYTQAAREALK